MSGFSGSGPQESKTLSDGGKLVNPLFEITQPGGPYPPGHILVTDGYGGYAIVPQADPLTFVGDYVGPVKRLDAVVTGADGKIRVAAAANSIVDVVGFVIDEPTNGKCTIRFSGIVEGFTELKTGFRYFPGVIPGRVSTESAVEGQPPCGLAISETRLLITRSV